jgi:PGAP1-like protein/Kelch motif/CARDB/Bacterial Ig domain
MTGIFLALWFLICVGSLRADFAMSLDSSDLFISNHDFISNPDSDIHDYLQYYYADGTAGPGTIRIASDPSDPGKTPLILIHGIDPSNVPGSILTDGWYEFVRFFYSTPELTSKYRLYIVGYRSNVVPIEQLGENLANVLTQLDTSSSGFRQKRFIVIAHSMGGLVSRVMMNQSRSDGTKWGDRVIKLITLATPHHGTPIANGIQYPGPLYDAFGVFGGIQRVETEFGQAYHWAVHYTQANRSDLLWDNYDGLYTHFFGDTFEQQPWLLTFNSQLAYVNTLILYAGTYTSGSHPPYTGTFLGVPYDTQGILATGLRLPSDGMVPEGSALFDGVGIPNSAIRVPPGNYDHTQMWRGHNYNAGPTVDNSSEPIFVSIKTDLLNNVPTSTTGQQTIAPSPFTITATAQTPNGIPTITIRIVTPSESGVSYAIHRDGTIFNFSGTEFINTTITPGATYHYFVRATSSAGLYTDSTTLTVIAPNPIAPPNTTAPAAPTGLAVNPASWARLNQFFVSWANPTHANNIVKVWYWIGNTPPGSGQGTSQPLPQGNPLQVTLPMQQGSTTIYVWLQDDHGNVNRNNYAPATLKLDPNAPSITPAINSVSTSASSTISINGALSDDLSGIAGLTWVNDLGGSGIANVVKSGDGLTATWSVPSVQLASGANHITFTATDNAGNAGHSTVTVNYYNGTANNSGSVQVTLLPQSAISAGAQWRFTGEVFWHSSGDIVNSYTGTRTINFSPADGWTAPPDNTVTVSAGQTTPLAVNYTVPLSSQPPYAASLPYPVDGAGNVSRNSLTLTWLGGSPNGTVTHALAMDTNPNVSISTAPIAAGYGGINGSSYPVLATLQPATPYFWRVYTKDHNGNVTIGPVWSFTTQYVIPDLVPSNLSIDGNISPGSTVTAHVTVINQGTFTAQGAYVNLYLSRTPGAKEAQLNPIASLPLHLPTALAPGQSVTLSGQVALNNLQTGQSFIDAWIDSSPWGASAESDYNNNTTSLAISYIDGSPPTVTYFAPQIAYAKTGASMALLVQATDDDSIKTLDFYYSTNGGTTWTAIQEGYVPITSLISGITYSWTVPTTLPVGGNLLLRVVATDPSGNFGEKIAGPYVIHDGTVPVVRVIFPNGGEALPAGSTQQFKWSISAPNGIQDATLSLYYNSSNVVTAQGITDYTTGTYSWTLPAHVTSTIAKIRITVRDQNGNTSEDWSDGPFSIVDNSQPPPAPWIAAAAVTSAVTGDTAGLPRIVADSTGTLHLIYGLTHDANAHTISFRYRKRIGTTWTSSTVVSFDVTSLDNQAGSSYGIGNWRFAVDSNGHPHLVWATSFNFVSEESKNDVFYTSFDGANWTPPQNISSSIRSPLQADSIAWTRKADISFASSASAAAAVGGKLYFIYYEQIYQYDPLANTWAREADAPSVVVNDGGATVVGNLIYAAGNATDGNIRIYNPSANSWSTGAAMPSPQQGVRLAAAANGMVYAIGGDIAPDSGGTKTRMYNPGANAWTMMADIPTARSHPAVAAVGTKIYVIGGYNQQQSMDVYDTVGNTWTTKAYPIAANIPPSFGGFAAVANNKIYFVPGMQVGGLVGEVAPESHEIWEYDPATGAWTRMLLSQFEHVFGCGVAIGSKLYVLGGYNGFNKVSSMEEGTLSADFAGTVSSSPQVAVDGANAAHVLWNDGSYLQADGSAFSSFSFAGQGNIYEAVKNGSSWSSPVQATTGGVSRHAVVADQSGNLHLSYQSYSNDVAYSQRIGSSWSAPVFAGAALSASYGLDIAVDSTMKVHFLYSGYDSQASLNVVNYVTFSGTAWSPPERVGTAVSGFPPRICMDSLNRPHAVWEGSTVNEQVLYSTRSGGGWVAPIQLNRASEVPAYGSVDAALWLGNNELDVVWLCSNSGNPNVLLNYANVGSALDIYPPTVAINSPVSGDILAIGNQATVAWVAADNVGVTAVDVSYSIDGTTWIPIATNIANTGSCQWTIPNATNALVRVTAYDAARNSGFGISGVLSPSDTTPPTVTVASPLAGASLTAGSPVVIQWVATDNVGVTKIDLEYSTDTGSSWLAIASALNNTGNFSWTVPNAVTSGLLIRATAHDNSGLATSALSQPLSIVASNTPPVAPNRPFPLDAAANVGLALPMLQWSSADADGDSLTYEIHFGTNSNPPVVKSGISPTYTPSALSYQTTYYWQVIASDGKATTAGPVWSFTTAPSVITPASASIISLSGDLAFGAVPVGAAVQNLLTIRNLGMATLNITNVNCPSGFTGSWSGSIAPGSFQYVLITFAPTLPASYGGEIAVTSDAGSGTNTIVVLGTGTSTDTLRNPPIAVGAKIQSGNVLVLTWPTNAVGFQLEFATNLGPSAIWTPVGRVASIVNGQNVLTNQLSGHVMFFRLRQ